MNLGLISDIHADIRALEATLGRLDEMDIRRVYCAGDLVGYGSEPDAVATLLKDRGIPCISGNHDRWALERRQVLGVRGWKPADLRDETWETLHQLPISRRVQLDGVTIEIHHGSPASDTEYITSYKPWPPSVEEFWNRNSAQYLVLGHTHIPMIERGPGGTVINPGSVLGVPGIPTSYTFALLDTADHSVRIFDVRTGREVRREPIALDTA
jgi:putative phosphoesterase